MKSILVSMIFFCILVEIEMCWLKSTLMLNQPWPGGKALNMSQSYPSPEDAPSPSEIRAIFV